MDIKYIRFDDAPRAATLGFLKKAIRCYDEQYGSDDEAAQPARPALPLATSQQLESVVVNVLGKAKKSFEQVNLEQLLENGGLIDLFPAEAWPELNAARDFATEIKAAKKGKSHVCICYLQLQVERMTSCSSPKLVNVDLKKYDVPFWPF